MECISQKGEAKNLNESILKCVGERKLALPEHLFT